MNDLDLKRRLRAVRWPSPSPELRTRVAATVVRPQTTAWSDRVWYSRRWRIGMAGAALALVALNVWNTPGTGTPASLTTLADVEVQTIADLVRSTGLPDDIAASIAMRSVVASRALTIDRESLFSGEDR